MILKNILKAIRCAVRAHNDGGALEYITLGEGLPHPLEPQEEADAVARLKSDPAVKRCLSSIIFGSSCTLRASLTTQAWISRI